MARCPRSTSSSCHPSRNYGNGSNYLYLPITVCLMRSHRILCIKRIARIIVLPFVSQVECGPGSVTVVLLAFSDNREIIHVVGTAQIFAGVPP